MALLAVPLPDYRLPIAALAVLLLAALPAQAQDTPSDLDRLYAELAAARDPFAAGRTETRIRHLLAETASASADLLLEQGHAAMAAGEPGLGLRKYEGAHMAAPGALEPLFARARALVALDRPREAVAALDALLSQEGRHLPALLLQAALRADLGQPDRARALLKRALTVSPQSTDAARALRALGAPGAD